MTDDFVKFLDALGQKEVCLRTFSDKARFLKGVEKNKGKIRCNSCGEYFDEKDIYLGIRNRPICKVCSPVKLSIEKESLSKYFNLLDFKNKNFHGVHLSINGAHRDEDVKNVVAQFFEIDSLPMEEQVEIVRKLPIRPSIVVKTRKSLHVYFLVKDGQVKRFREIQKRLAYTYEGDMQKANPSTCMRVPGYYHHKKEPIMVKLIHCDKSLVYTQDEIIDKLKLYRLPEPPKRKRFDFEGSRDDLYSMVMGHIDQKILYETSNKIIMECVNPLHDDKNPSAVMFKDGLNFYCSGCGYSARLQEVAREQSWYDILNYIEEKKRA